MIKLALLLLALGVVAALLYRKKGVRGLYGPAIAIVATTLSLLLAEFAVRFAFNDVTSTPDNGSYFAQRWRREHPPLANALGFRDREVPAKGDKFRIAVVGDSFAYGQGIVETERFSEQLAVLLEQNVPGAFEVYNFARPGTETVDHIEILKQSVLPTNPDFVLLQWYVNDAENGRYDGRPSFLPLIPSATASRYFNDHSGLYYLLNDAWQRIQAATGIVSRRNYVEYMVERFGDPSSESAVFARERIVEFVTLAKEDGAAMVGIVMFPQLTDGLLNDYPLGFLLDNVQDACAELAITCVDLRSVFDPVQPKQLLWANRLDSHPGALANALAAEAILKAFDAEWRVDQ